MRLAPNGTWPSRPLLSHRERSTLLCHRERSAAIQGHPHQVSTVRQPRGAVRVPPRRVAATPC